MSRAAAKATTKLGLAMAIAALCMIAPSGAAALGGAAKSARDARRPFTNAAFWPAGIRSTTGAMSKLISIGPAWRDMGNRNELANPPDPFNTPSPLNTYP